jgi:peptidoglycan/LPS O-acetylase OafA/YrhL
MTVIGAFWWGTWHPTWNLNTQWHYQYLTSLAGAILTFALAFAARRLPVPRPLAWLGMISYSVYMTHPILLDAYSAIVGPQASTLPMPQQVALALGLLAAILAVAAATHYCVERPAQRLGKTVAHRLRTGKPPTEAAATVTFPPRAPGGVALPQRPQEEAQ